MKNEITIKEVQFKVFMLTLFSEHFKQLAWRYARINEAVAAQLLVNVVDQFWLRLQRGEAELLNTPIRTIESMGTKEIIRYLKNEIPELHI